MSREDAQSLSLPTGARSENVARTTVSERMLFSALRRIQRGELVLRYGDQEHRFGPGGSESLRAEVHVHDRALFSRLLTNGTIVPRSRTRMGSGTLPTSRQWFAYSCRIERCSTEWMAESLVS